MKTVKEKALEIAGLLEDSKAGDVVVIDVAAVNTSTIFLILFMFLISFFLIVILSFCIHSFHSF